MFVISVFLISGIWAVAALGLNLQWGYTGLFNIGVAAFMGIGAYTFAILTTPDAPPTGALPGHLGGFGLPVWAGVLGAMALAGFIGFLIALPTLRLRADYLAIATLGLAEIMRLYWLNALTITGGPFSISRVPRPDADISSLWVFLTGQPVVVGPNLSAAILLTVVVLSIVVVYFVFERSVRSPWGRVLKSIREDEDAAQALGKNTFRYKMQAFVLGAMVMGVAGALLANFFRVVEAGTTFVPTDTFFVWIIVIVGGSGNHKGAILGAFLIVGIFEFSRLLTASLPGFLESSLVFTPVLGILAAMAFGLSFVDTRRGRPGRARLFLITGGACVALMLVFLSILSPNFNFAFIRLIGVGSILILLMMYRPQGLLGEERKISRMG